MEKEIVIENKKNKGMNKIYSVLRIDNWDRTQSVYEGRIRDCKKS